MTVRLASSNVVFLLSFFISPNGNESFLKTCSLIDLAASVLIFPWLVPAR